MKFKNKKIGLMTFILTSLELKTSGPLGTSSTRVTCLTQWPSTSQSSIHILSLSVSNRFWLLTRMPYSTRCTASCCHQIQSSFLLRESWVQAESDERQSARFHRQTCARRVACPTDRYIWRRSRQMWHYKRRSADVIGRCIRSASACWDQADRSRERRCSCS